MRRAGEEGGFSLVELLVATVIAGIITFAVGTSLVVGLKTTFSTAAELRQSGNAQLLAQYFGPDVQSVSSSGVDRSGTSPTGCSGSTPAGSSNLLRLDVVDAGTGALVRAVSYRRESAEVARYACAPGGGAERTTVARDVTAATVPAPSGGRVRMTVTVTDPDDEATSGALTFTVSGVHRTPPPGCHPASGSTTAAPDPAALAAGGQLATTVTVTFTTVGTCSGGAPVVAYQYGAVGVGGTVTATGGAGGTWTAALPKAAAGAWTAGVKSLTVTSDGVSRTRSFSVYDPDACAVAGGPTGTPSTQSSGTLVAAVAITLTTSGTCTGPGTFVYQFGAAVSDIASGSLSRAGSVWTGTIPVTAHAGTWTSGTKPFTVNVDGTASGTGNFAVTTAPTCAFTSGSLKAEPSPVLLRKGHVGSAPALAQTVQVSFKTSMCSLQPATVSYGYDGTTARATVTASHGAGNENWTAQIPVAAPAGGGGWTVGARPVSVKVGSLPEQTVTFDVGQGCAVSKLELTPSSAKVANSGALPNDVQVKITTVGPCTAVDLGSVSYQWGGPSDVGAVAVSGAGTSWTATLPANPPGAGKWTTGKKPVSVQVGEPGLLQKTSAELDVT